MNFRKVFKPYRVFVEMRHNSWNSPLMYNYFQENRLHLVNVDLPQIKQHMPFNAQAWNGAAYFRMMGRNISAGEHTGSERYNYLYSERELEHLLYYVEKMKANGNTVYVVFHNDPEANSLKNGFHLRHLTRLKHR